MKSFSQTNTTSIVIGKQYLIQSNYLNEEREVQVYIPKGYEKDKMHSYPVLYVLDGQEYFLHGVAYQDMLRFRDKSPEFIIVGINTDRRKRRSLFFKESDKFIDFLQKELIPFIDTNFRTKKEKERLYFGWEMAGGLGLQILADENELFSGFIIASPTHASEKRMDALKKINKSNTFILLTAAPEEHWITEDTSFLSIINNPINNKKWRYSVLDREDHYTTPLKTIHEGLSDYFGDYKPIRLRSVKAYDDYGGLSKLRAYYKRRGERYDLPVDIHHETKHFLLFNALKEDNYKRFQLYVNEFEGYLESNSRDIWFDRYARFYLKHGNVKKALYLFNYGINKIPESSLLYEGLGDLYAENLRNTKALKAYKKALMIDSFNTKVSDKISVLKKRK